VGEGAVLGPLDDTEAQGAARAHAGQIGPSRFPASRGPGPALSRPKQENARRRSSTSENSAPRRLARRGVAQRDMMRARLATPRRGQATAIRSRFPPSPARQTVVSRAPFQWGVIANSAQARRDDLADLAGGGLHEHRIGTMVEMDAGIQVESRSPSKSTRRARASGGGDAHAYPDWKNPREVIAIIRPRTAGRTP